MAKDTKEKKALTKEEVDQQDSKTRLWQSLSDSYGKQLEQSNSAYDKAISQADRQALSRGMQRSSYNNATLANLQNQKVKAQNDINSALIADYQNRLAQQEETEAARAFQTSEREASQEYQAAQNALAREFQTAERLGTQEYQSAENALNRAFSTSEREAQQAYQSGENALNRQFTTSEREAQQKYQSGENALNRAFTTSEREAQQAYQAGENALNRAFSTSEREAQQAYQSGENAAAREFQAQQNLQNQQWQSGENALNRQQSQSQFDTQLAYQKERNVIEDAFRQQQLDMQQQQWEAQQAQWREEFEYSKMTNDQKIAFEVISAAVGNGQDVSDDILQRAGISRDDFNSMKTQAKSSGTVNPKIDTTDPTKPPVDKDVEQEEDDLMKRFIKAAKNTAGAAYQTFKG